MKALSAKEPDSNYDGWDNAGLARAHEDWLFGINGTRYLSLKSGVLLPWGRCKYIITKAIVDRERAITNFVPVDYFAVVSKTNVKGYDIELTRKKHSIRIPRLMLRLLQAGIMQQAQGSHP